MIVADLREHLRDLAKLLEAAGGRSVAKDFTQMSEALAPFESHSLPEFTRFLALAHEYHATGKLSTPAKSSRTPAARATKLKTDPAQAARTMRALYDRAGDLSLPMEQIENDVAVLTGLTKPGLLIVCEAMELFGMKNKTVGDIRAAVRQKILDRRSGAQRAAMIQEGAG